MTNAASILHRSKKCLDSSINRRGNGKNETEENRELKNPLTLRRMAALSCCVFVSPIAINIRRRPDCSHFKMENY